MTDLDLTEAIAAAWTELDHRKGWGHTQRQVVQWAVVAAAPVILRTHEHEMRERIAADIEGRCIGEAVWDEATRNAARIIRGGAS